MALNEPTAPQAPQADDPSKWAIPYYKGVYGGLKGYTKSLATLAYKEGNIGPGDAAGFAEFIKTNPKAQQVLAAADKAGLGGEVRNRSWEFGNHFLRNEILPSEAELQQADATKQAFGRAEDYKKNLGQTIESETSALRGSLAAQLAEARGTIKQQENARGMLYSGQRQKKEGIAQNLAGKQFAEGAGQIAQGAQETSAGLFGQASALRSGAKSAQDQSQAIMDRAKEARQSATGALQSQYANLLGQGIGRYAGEKFGGENKEQG